MGLSKVIIDDFAKVTNDDRHISQNTTLYGTIKVNGDKNYVQLDGSDLLTPCSSSVNIKDGERVMVVVGGHGAVVTGNMSSPAARLGDVDDAKKEIGETVDQSLDAYDVKLAQMNELAANTLGFYYTEEKAADGSIIAYRHDKAKLSESKIIYKNGIDGFFLSVDGGQTWKAGFDSNGDAVLNILYAIGIQSKWINTRGFTATDNSGKETFKIDENTGSVYIDPNTFMLGNKGIADTINGIVSDASTVFMLLSNEYQGIVTDANGNIVGDFPNCQTTITIMSGNNDVTAEATIQSTLIKGIIGEWDAETFTYTVTGLTEDNCYIEFTAVYNDSTVKKRFTVCKQRDGKDGKDGSNLSSAEIWNLLLQQNTDFMYKGSDGKIYLKATYIDTGDFCGWTADRANKCLKATAQMYPDVDGDSYFYGSIILDASRATVKTIGDEWPVGGYSYAALNGNTVYAQYAKIFKFLNNATFNKSIIAEGSITGKNGLSIPGGNVVFSKKLNVGDRLTVLEQIYAPNTLAGSGQTLCLSSGGFIKKTSSSKRYKKHVSFIKDTDVKKLYELRPVYFNYKEGILDDDDEDCHRTIPGFYAELVDKYFPEAVVHDGKGRVEDWDVRKLVPAMLKLIQLQKEQLDRQEERLSKIESILNIKEE